MKIHLLAVGKTNQKFIQQGLIEYCSRLAHYFPFEMEIIPDIKNTKNIPVECQKEKEGELILRSLQTNDCVVLLDEKGKEFTSENFAGFIEKKAISNVKRLVFIIGGTYGFSSKVYEVADEKIALSKMTFPYQLVRLIFVEQLYRAMTILHNEAYHHL